MHVQVAAGYDLWAPTYDAHPNPLAAMSDAAVDEVVVRVRGKRVLELGCGTGRFARRFLAAGAQAYVGVDASAGMLARARVLADPRAAWIQADLASLPDDLGEFDVAFFGLVLEHFEEVTGVVARAARALAKGGLFVALELHPELHRRGVGAHFEVGGETVRLPSYAHDARELRAACGAADLAPVRVCEWFPDPESTARCPKLARYTGVPVLLDVRAVR